MRRFISRAAVTAACLLALTACGTEPITQEPKPKAPTATVQKTPEQRFTSAIKKALDGSDRDVKRVSESSYDPATGIGMVTWAINDGLNADHIRSNGKRDVLDMLKAVKKLGIRMDRLTLSATYASDDGYGNTSEMQVVRVEYSTATLARMNPANLSPDQAFDLADDLQESPAWKS